jgi:tetratricopeptide (TPR) repeat protein
MSGLSKKLVWAEIHIRPTLAGKMVSAFWRTPIVYLRITLKNNQQYLYYLPREMGKTGFLLSPLISNNMDFAKLASKNSEVELSENVVKSFAILIENSAPDSWAFEPNILLSFSFLDFPKQDLGDLLTEIKQEEEKTKKRSEVNSLIQLSLTQIQQQDFVGAIISCEKAVKLEPTNNIAYNNLGFSYTKLLLFDKAINAFNKAIEISPEFVLAKNNLLDAKLSQNTTVDSNQLINNYMALTLSYINNNMFDEAITSCEAILKINPNHAISYNNICVAYNGLRLWDKAIIAAQKAIAIDPNFQLAKNNLAWAKSQKEQANLSK